MAKKKMDQSQPIMIGVRREGDHVAFRFGDLVIGLSPETAQEFAENTLAVVGGIIGREFMLNTLTPGDKYSWDTLRARKDGK